MRFKEGSESFRRRYMIFEPLGAGGMAAVYRAKDRLGGFVALKRLVPVATRIAAKNAVASPVETTCLLPDEIEDRSRPDPSDPGGEEARARAESGDTAAISGGTSPLYDAPATLASTELPSSTLPAGAAGRTVELPTLSTITGTSPALDLPPARVGTATDTLARPFARAPSGPGVGRGGGPSDGDMRLRLALATEFQTLSSVRHPNVINVLDYGFDEIGQPYFAMELLERARTVLEAGAELSFRQKIGVLEQMLQALHYLHRRRVIHRDIKPGNVLVVGDRVKVVDFGVSVLAEEEREQGRSIVGTPAYMAPELFHGKSATEASDLYAVGVIAYELLTGKALFNTKDVWAAVADALYKIPDLTPLDPRIAPVIGKLLAKDPAQRYADAAEVIAALSEATGEPLRVETAATRESCLSAARLVGRDAEIAILTKVLDDVLDGRGSAWIVGGESGVGKSRLLDELRARALVAGAAVLRGQEVSEGAAPYQVFCDVLRWLVLLTDPTDEEASVLKPLVPDMAALLGRDVESAPEVAPDAFHARLAATVEDMLRRLRQPALILLEDLHWSRSDSIKLLARISAVTADLPVLLVASYRDDERPDLPTLLPAMKTIKLERLTPVGIAVLTESMIGASGSRPEVIERLILETEGNPFFLVEVLRTLAERAGQLDRIAEGPLSASVSSQGMDRIVARRLRQVPPSARPLLEAAAVAGRRIDPALMQAIDPQVRVEDWLAVCTGAAVLDAQDGRPRFAHDKLREGLLAELSDDRRRALHRQVAAAIEAVHPEDPGYAASLAHHFAAAGDATKASLYAGLAGEQALASSAYQEAVELFEQAIALLPEDPGASPDRAAGVAGALVASLRSFGRSISGQRRLQTGPVSVQRARWEGLLSETHSRLGNHTEGLRHGRRALAQLGIPMPDSAVGAALDLGAEAVQLGLRSALPAAFGERSSEARGVLAEAAQIQRRVTETFFYTQESLPLFLSGLRMLNLGESAGPSPELAGMYTIMGVVVGLVPLHAIADRWCRSGYDLARDQCSTYELAYVLQRNSAYQMTVGRWSQAEERLRRGIAIAERAGDRRQWEESSMMQGMVFALQGRTADAIRISVEIMASARRRGDGQTIFWGAVLFTMLGIRRGAADGLEQLEASLPWVESSGSASDVIHAKGIQALAYLRRGDRARARDLAEQALHLFVEKRPVAYWTYHGVAAMVLVLLALWEREQSSGSASVESIRALAERACDRFWVFAQIFPFSAPAAHIFQGIAEQLSGRSARARRSFSKAIALAEQLGMPYERGRAHFERGRHGHGEDRERDLSRALALFAEVDAQPERALAQAALEKSRGQPGAV